MSEVPTVLLPASRRCLFALILLVFGLGLVELGARGIEILAASRESATDSLVEVRNPVPVFELTGSGPEAVYKRTRFHPLMLSNLEFPAEKGPNTLRIFLLGGSAAAAWPFALGGYSITDLLARKLSALLPGKRLEVLNVAAGTYASHRVRFVFDEIIDYEPDLILIYSGNNEFLERFVFGSADPKPPWNRSAIVRILYRAARESDEAKPTFDVENYSYADQRSNRLSYAFGRASRYREDPEQFRQLLESYRSNIEWMVSTCVDRGIPVMLLNVPVNLKDWSPNVSRHRADFSEPGRALWQTQYRDGVLALEAGDALRAAEALETAVQLDDEYAEAHYRLGLARLQLRETGAARAAFLRALERDAYPFRALPEFQRILTEVADAHAVPLVDIVGALERKATDGILGLDVLIDYVHLSADSIELVAHEILLAMARESLLPQRASVRIGRMRVPVPDFGPDMELLELDSLYRQNLVMRQYDKLDGLHRRFIEAIKAIAEARPELLDLSRKKLARIGRVHAAVEPYRRLLRAEQLGLLEEEFTLERARKVYSRYVRAIREIEAPNMPRNEFLEFVPRLKYRVPATSEGRTENSPPEN